MTRDEHEDKERQEVIAGLMMHGCSEGLAWFLYAMGKRLARIEHELSVLRREKST